MAKLKLESLRNDIEKYIISLDTAKNRKLYLDGDIVNYDKVKDINERYRFDVLYSIPHKVRNKFYDAAYSMGANDKHISSLLKSMIEDL